MPAPTDRGKISPMSKGQVFGCAVWQFAVVWGAIGLWGRTGPSAIVGWVLLVGFQVAVIGFATQLVQGAKHPVDR